MKWEYKLEEQKSAITNIKTYFNELEEKVIKLLNSLLKIDQFMEKDTKY